MHFWVNQQFVSYLAQTNIFFAFILTEFGVEIYSYEVSWMLIKKLFFLALSLIAKRKSHIKCRQSWSLFYRFLINVKLQCISNNLTCAAIIFKQKFWIKVITKLYWYKQRIYISLNYYIKVNYFNINNKYLILL